MRSGLATAALLLLSGNCGGGSSSGAPGAAAPAPAQAARGGSSRDVITKAEIEQTQGVPNAFELVRRLRRNFFRVEGRTSLRQVPQEPLVRLDGQLLGDISTLRSISVTTLEEIRYYSIVEAETKWSGTRGRPVIALTTRK